MTDGRYQFLVSRCFLSVGLKQNNITFLLNILRALRTQPACLSSSFIFPVAFSARTVVESGKIFRWWKHTLCGSMTAGSSLNSFTPFPSFWRGDRRASKLAALLWVLAVHPCECWVKSSCVSVGIVWSWMIKTSFLPLASNQRGFVRMSSWQINLISFFWQDNCLENKRNWVETIYLNFLEVFWQFFYLVASQWASERWSQHSHNKVGNNWLNNLSQNIIKGFAVKLGGNCQRDFRPACDSVQHFH